MSTAPVQKYSLHSTEDDSAAVSSHSRGGSRNHWGGSEQNKFLREQFPLTCSERETCLLESVSTSPPPK